MRQPSKLELHANSDTRSYMVEFIKEHFSEILGVHVELLDQPGGLDALAEMMRNGEIGTRRAA